MKLELELEFNLCDQLVGATALEILWKVLFVLVKEGLLGSLICSFLRECRSFTTADIYTQHLRHTVD